MIWSFIKNASYLKGFSKRSVATVISIENPYDDYYVIALKPESKFKWRLENM